MRPAHALALVLIPFLTVAGAVAATWFQRVRDIFFFLMVSVAVFAERLDVNFFSQAWYRGTTRGVQVTLLEILAFGLLIGCWIGRRGGERRWFWPASLGLMLAYTAYAALSVLVSEPRIFGVFELSKMAAGILVFLAAAAYVRGKREWTLLLVALGCAVGFEGLWAVKQHFILRRSTGCRAPLITPTACRCISASPFRRSSQPPSRAGRVRCGGSAPPPRDWGPLALS